MNKSFEELQTIINKIPPYLNYRVIVNYSIIKDNECLISVRDTKYFINNNTQKLNLTIENDELFYYNL